MSVPLPPPARGLRSRPVEVSSLRAACFDMDGVLLDTEPLHREALAGVMEELGRRRAFGRAFDPVADYRSVRGRPRYSAVRWLIGELGVALPHGVESDPPGFETVCAVANLKNERFAELVRAGRVAPFEDALRLAEKLRLRGVRLAVVSSSRNASALLRAAGMRPLFDVVLDGEQAARMALPGKPDPAPYRWTMRRLGEPPEQSMVLEDAPAGVRAARAAGCGLVVAVARERDERCALAEAGAHLIVSSAAEIPLLD